MNNRFLKILVTFFAFLSLIPADGTTLKPHNVQYPRIPYGEDAYRPIRFIGWTFDKTHVAVTQDMPIVVYCSKDSITQGILGCQNYTYNDFNDRKVGFAFIDLGAEICLPKGHNYHFTIPAHNIWSIDSADTYNDTLRLDFLVPECPPFSAVKINGKKVTENDTVPYLNTIGFGFNEELDTLPGSHINLYRKNVRLHTYSLWTWADMGLGQVEAYVKGIIRCEKGIPYTIELPEASIKTFSGRDDIYNKAVRLTFIGGYNTSNPAEDPHPLEYDRCAVENWMSPDCAGQLRAYYQTAITFTDDPKIQLWRSDARGDSLELWEEKTPEIITEGGEYVLQALFNSKPLEWEDGDTYFILIPEATVMQSTGHPNVNPEVKFFLQPAGLEDMALLGPVMRVVKDGIEIRNAERDQTVMVYGMDGRMVAAADVIGPEPFTVPVPAPGVYVVAVGATVHKVVVR